VFTCYCFTSVCVCCVGFFIFGSQSVRCAKRERERHTHRERQRKRKRETEKEREREKVRERQSETERRSERDVIMQEAESRLELDCMTVWCPLRGFGSVLWLRLTCKKASVHLLLFSSSTLVQ